MDTDNEAIRLKCEHEDCTNNGPLRIGGRSLCWPHFYEEYPGFDHLGRDDRTETYDYE